MSNFQEDSRGTYRNCHRIRSGKREVRFGQKTISASTVTSQKLPAVKCLPATGQRLLALQNYGGRRRGAASSAHRTNKRRRVRRLYEPRHNSAFTASRRNLQYSLSLSLSLPLTVSLCLRVRRHRLTHLIRACDSVAVPEAPPLRMSSADRAQFPGHRRRRRGKERRDGGEQMRSVITLLVVSLPVAPKLLHRNSASTRRSHEWLGGANGETAPPCERLRLGQIAFSR